MLRSGTSAGANYEEARAAESRADFVHKVGLAAKEMRETIYWLKLVSSSAMVPVAIDKLARECDELVAILVASSRTARSTAP
jgi:four helix bundle protein